MKVIDLYNVVLTNENGDVCGVKSFLTEDEAKKCLAEMHKADLEMIESADLFLDEDKFNIGCTVYSIWYEGEYLYHGEVSKSVLKIEED